MGKLLGDPEVLALVAHAKILSGEKLERLVERLQRHSGQSRQACWRFVIQHGIKRTSHHRPWTESEIDTLREELIKKPLEEVAKKLKRTPEAIRSILKRQGLGLRSIRCDLFSVESLASALHVGRKEVLYWIEQKWLLSSVTMRGKKCFYTITPDALTALYKNHLHDLLRRGLANQSLFEAFLAYCYVPKHTNGEQLLDVRRDKRERAAYASTQEEPITSSDREDDDID